MTIAPTAAARQRHAFEGRMLPDFSAEGVVTRIHDGTTFATQVAAHLGAAEAGE